MNAKRTIITVIAAYAVVWVTDYLIHEMALKADYLATKNLWRDPEQMKHFFKWILVGELLVATGLTVIWNRGFAATAKPMCALGFGTFAGLLGGAYAPIFYAVMPIPGLLCVKWFIFGVLQCILVSLTLHALTRPAKTA